MLAHLRLRLCLPGYLLVSRGLGGRSRAEAVAIRRARKPRQALPGDSPQRWI
uniref:Peptidyl-tRNA hydrolase n=1 Tax=Arundo donax TaxID=35708 RepID=A0A0A9H2F7_ARUDO